MARRQPLVVDSNIAVFATTAHDLPTGWRLIAPPLLWTEATSALHEAAWRREISGDEAREAYDALQRMPITPDEPPELRDEAWRIADELGLAKTYDAEFLALARIRRTLVVTADAKLRRVADRLGLVIDPIELRSHSQR